MNELITAGSKLATRDVESRFDISMKSEPSVETSHTAAAISASARIRSASADSFA